MLAFFSFLGFEFQLRGLKPSHVCVLIAKFDVALQNASFGSIHQGRLRFGLAVVTGESGCSVSTAPRVFEA